MCRSVSEPQADSPPGKTEAASLRSPGAILRRLGPAGPLAIVAGTLPALGGFVLLGLLNVVGPWLRGHAEAGVTLYVAGFILMAGLALLPTYAQAVLGGWAFGFAFGFPAALAGCTGAALVGYAVAWWAGGERVTGLITSDRKWSAVHQTLVGSGFARTLLVVTLLRLPSTPFALTNLVMGTTRVGLGAYLLGTALGIAPRTAAAVYVAAHMAQLDFGQARNIWLSVGGIVGLLIVLAIIGQMANSAIARVTGADSTAGRSPGLGRE